jgi:hypothetical protein
VRARWSAGARRSSRSSRAGTARLSNLAQGVVNGGAGKPRVFVRPAWVGHGPATTLEAEQARHIAPQPSGPSRRSSGGRGGSTPAGLRFVFAALRRGIDVERQCLDTQQNSPLMQRLAIIPDNYIRCPGSRI